MVFHLKCIGQRIFKYENKNTIHLVDMICVIYKGKLRVLVGGLGISKQKSRE